MPSGDINTANIGTPIPVSYGFFRATGMRRIDFTVPSTAGTFPNMQIGFWDLGEGELDGCDALWIDNVLQFAFDPYGSLMGTSTVGVTPADPATTGTLQAFSFHTGCDAPLGMPPGESAVYQWLDPLTSYIGDLITPLCYSRRSYFAIGWIPPTDGSLQLAPIGDFRGMRCRIFDAYGNQVDYRFTVNPWWHWVDAWLRRAVKQEYAIDQATGPTALTASESACFHWPSIAAAADYCDELLANGLPRFSNSSVFTSGTLASWCEQILLSCRGYYYEYAGQLRAYCDQPRDSVCHVTAKHLAQSAIAADQTQINQAGNRYVGSFLELGLPAIAQISTITRTSTTVAIHTPNPNPMAVGDLVSVGGVDDSTFDASYVISAVPSDTEADSTITGGAAGSSANGWIGYIQSRFSRRAPEIAHRQHQLARGQVLPPSTGTAQHKRVKVAYDFASMTYDQVNRILKYEVYRDLGIDYLNPVLVQQLFGDLTQLGAPYRPPIQLTLSLWSETVDANMQALKDKLPGSVITIDADIMFDLAGDYEILDRWINPIQQESQDAADGSFVAPMARPGSLTRSSDQNSGVLKLLLRSYDERVFFDVSDAPSASFQTVPGYLPYGGDTSSAGSMVIGSGATLSASTAPGGGSFASWTAITVRLGNGTILNYTTGTMGISSSSPSVLYIDDPALGGGGGKVFTGSSYPAPGTGIIRLNSFSAPPAPPVTAPGPNTVTYQIVSTYW